VTELHPDLARQFSKNIKILILKDIKAAVILLRELLIKKDESDIITIKFDEIKKITLDILKKELHYFSAESFEGIDFSDVTIEGVNELKLEESDINYVEINEDDLILSIQGEVFVEVSGFIDKYEYWNSISEDDEEPIDKEIEIFDANHNDTVMHVGQSIWTPFDLTLTYSLVEKKKLKTIL